MPKLENIFTINYMLQSPDIQSQKSKLIKIETKSCCDGFCII